MLSFNLSIPRFAEDIQIYVSVVEISQLSVGFQNSVKTVLSVSNNSM